MSRTSVALLAAGALAALVAASPAADAPSTGADTAKAADSITWRTSYATALKDAGAAGKPILFDFYTGWCPHCVHMDKSTWLDASVAKLASSFVPARVNADVEKVPVQRYRLTGFPTVLVAEPGGSEMLRLSGYHDASQMGDALKAYLDKADALKEAYAKLKGSDGDVAANLCVGGFLASAGAPDQAYDHFQKALKNAQGDDFLTASAGAGMSLNASGKSKQAAKILDAALEKAGTSPPASLLLARGQAETGMGHADTAKPWYERVIKEHPDCPEAKTAAAALAAPASGT